MVEQALLAAPQGNEMDEDAEFELQWAKEQARLKFKAARNNNK